MLLEETVSPVTMMPTTFPEPLPQMVPQMVPSGGTVTMTITTDKPPVLLSGSGTDWTTQGSTLYLAPLPGEKLPLWYSFVFQMDPLQGYKLLGALVYPVEVPADVNANLYYPVGSDGTVTVNLMHNLGPGAKSVSYMLEVGYTDGIVTNWVPDPTITFEPQG